MVRPTDTYGERPRGTLQRLLVKGALLGITTGVIGALAGWTRQVDAVDHDAVRDLEKKLLDLQQVCWISYFLMNIFEPEFDAIC